MTVLADTSIWVEYLRRGRSFQARLDDLLVAGEVVACGPVVAERLAGAKSPARGRLWLLLTGLPWAELGPVQWQSIGETSARLGERGESVALTDVEIAVAAVDSSSRLWTRDSDLKQVRAVLPALQFFDP
ncbi:MAG: PIN domain-containing protein [Solirubrobacteraceae bacterium]